MSKITLDIGAVPATPDPDQVVLYPKSDKRLYQKDEDGLEIMVTRAGVAMADLFVDVRRSDSYTADGSREWPYKTVMAAVNKIISNADNSSSKPYAIRIVGPCTVTENVVLESTLLTDIYLYGDGPYGSVNITPASGLSLQSIANNINLHILIIENIVFSNGVTLAGSADSSSFCAADGRFVDCDFFGALSLSNADGLTISGGGIHADTAIENIFALFMVGGFGYETNIDISYDSGANKPSGLTVCNLILDNCVVTGDITLGDDTTLQVRGGARIGSPGGSLNIGNGTATLYPCFIRSNMTVGASGTLIQRGGVYKDSTLSMSGTHTQEIALGNFKCFKSSEQTGTGASQNIAHGLGYTPKVVIVSVTDDSGVLLSGFTVTEGSHGSTNVVVTVTTGTKYKVVAF